MTGLRGVDLKMVEAVAGRECALQLALALGGRTIYVPERCAGKNFDELEKAVGRGCAATIVEHFGRDSIYVPFSRKALVPWLAGKGLSKGEIASELRLALPTVRQYLAA